MGFIRNALIDRLYLLLIFAQLLSSNCISIWSKTIQQRSFSRLHAASIENEIVTLLESTVLRGTDLSANDIHLEQRLGDYSYRFKCSVRNNPAFFVKYTSTDDDESLLNIQRLRCDYEGITAFSRYTPAFVPAVLAYNPSSGIAIFEYLNDFRPLQRLLESGGVPADVSRFIGTVMGRNHGRTHKAAVPVAKSQQYIAAFSSQQPSSSLLWASRLNHLAEEMKIASSRPQAAYDPQLSRDDDPFSQSPMDLLLQMDSDHDSLLTRSVRMSLETYTSKMETLIHGDLDATNILFRQRKDDEAEGRGGDGDGPAGISLKVVDFEGCRFGAAGVDLGMFLGSLVSFFAAHSLSAPRRNLLGQVAAAIDAYRVSFRIQFEATSRKAGATAATATNSARDLDALLQNILADAVGIAGCHVLLQAIEPGPLQQPGRVDRVIPLEKVLGCSWGDVAGKQRSVRRRMVRIAGQLLQLSLQHYQLSSLPQSSSTSSASPPPSISADSIAKALRMDDSWLSSDHYTEFWSL